MANLNKRLLSNVDGNFFVDATCINCDTCRQLAPKSFEEVGEYSAVVDQPMDDEHMHQAYQALLTCPVGSIGTEHSNKIHVQAAMASFPLHLEGDVFYCGFNSEKSFGANSFFVQHEAGNWLIDSPRYIKHLVEAFEKKGGIRYIFLTHEDDVADADKYAKHFGARRIIHREDAEAVPDAEWIVEGSDATELAPAFRAIPVPGHTPGSQTLLYQDQFLFTGDHLWWEPKTRTLGAPRRLVWREVALVRSLEKLLKFRFEWVLAGHGDRIKLLPDDMAGQLRALVERRRASMAAHR